MAIDVKKLMDAAIDGVLEDIRQGPNSAAQLDSLKALRTSWLGYLDSCKSQGEHHKPAQLVSELRQTVQFSVSSKRMAFQKRRDATPPLQRFPVQEEASKP